MQIIVLCGLMTAGSCLGAPSSSGGEGMPASASAWQAAWGKLPYNGDGNFSSPVLMAGGVSVWVTGDAAPRAGGPAEGKPWASNTIIMVGRDGVLKQYSNVVSDVKQADGTTRSWWPGPITVLPDGRLVSPGSWVLRTPGVGLGFAPLYGELVVFTMNGGVPRRSTSVRPPVAPGGIRWSSGVWSGPDGWLYVFGTTEGRPGQWGVDAYVSRVDSDTLAVDSWRYWSGRTWAHSSNAAAPILRASSEMGTDTAFSVTQDSYGRWIIYTRRVTWTSNEHGSYRGGPTIGWRWFPRGTEAGYLPSSHPEVKLTNGKLLVTVNEPNTGARFLEVAR